MITRLWKWIISGQGFRIGQSCQRKSATSPASIKASKWNRQLPSVSELAVGIMTTIVAMAMLINNQARAADALSAEQSNALAPLKCEGCIELSKLVAYRNVQKSGEARLWSIENSMGSRSSATESDITQKLGSTAIVAPDGLRAPGNVVCLGRRLPDVHIETATTPAYNSADLTAFSANSDSGITAVCTGALQDLEVFLRGVVDAMYMKQLEKYEKAVSTSAIDSAIKASLASVVFQYQTQWAAKVKADVLAELDQRSPPTSSSTPQPSSDQPQACVSGNLATCGSGMSATKCCRCLEADGTAKFGTCAQNLTSGSWKPKPMAETKQKK